VANPAGFVKADATYGLSYEELHNTPEAWPATYQNPAIPVFSVRASRQWVTRCGMAQQRRF
jgi:hypothetical protein